MTDDRPLVLRRWPALPVLRTDVPNAFPATAVLGTLVLALLEFTTPFDIRYRELSRGSFLVEDLAPVWWHHVLWALASCLLVAAPWAALRSLPLSVSLVLPRVLVGALSDFAWPWTAYAALVLVAVVASGRRPRSAGLVVAAATTGAAAVILSRGRMMTPGHGSVEFGPPALDRGPGELLLLVVLYLVASVGALLVAVLLRRDSTHVRDAFELVRRRRDVAREAAIVGERARLARDLHDVVAHHISLIAVRAETAPYTYPALSADARLVLDGIAADSRSALEELRRLLGVLRRADGAPDRAPQPGAPDIGALVLEAQNGTDVVSASLEGLDGVLPTPGYVAYRVVQEALTNARRHAPGVPVDVTAHGDGAGGVRVLVTNRAASTAEHEPGGGLTGMRERVVAVGGQLHVGMRSGEMVVDALIPATAPGDVTP